MNGKLMTCDEVREEFAPSKIADNLKEIMYGHVFDFEAFNRGREVVLPPVEMAGPELGKHAMLQAAEYNVYSIVKNNKCILTDKHIKARMNQAYVKRADQALENLVQKDYIEKLEKGYQVKEEVQGLSLPDGELGKLSYERAKDVLDKQDEVETKIVDTRTIVPFLHATTAYEVLCEAAKDDDFEDESLPSLEEIPQPVPHIPIVPEDDWLPESESPTSSLSREDEEFIEWFDEMSKDCGNNVHNAHVDKETTFLDIPFGPLYLIHAFSIKKGISPDNPLYTASVTWSQPWNATPSNPTPSYTTPEYGKGNAKKARMKRNKRIRAQLANHQTPEVHDRTRSGKIIPAKERKVNVKVDVGPIPVITSRTAIHFAPYYPIPRLCQATRLTLLSGLELHISASPEKPPTTSSSIVQLLSPPGHLPLGGSPTTPPTIVSQQSSGDDSESSTADEQAVFRARYPLQRVVSARPSDTPSSFETVD